jgi:hypothetical protein
MIINGKVIGKHCTQHFGIVSRESLLVNRGNFSSFVFIFTFLKLKSTCVMIPPCPGGGEITVRRLGRAYAYTIVGLLQS